MVDQIGHPFGQRNDPGGPGVTIAVDAMGGDYGPTEVVPGALDHARSHPTDSLLLVGDETTIRTIGGELPANVEIVHASQVIGMDEHPAKALREKKDSTILVATDLVKNGRADAVVTAGHTGAGMAAAVLRLGRLPGVDRPALAVQMSTDAGPIVLLRAEFRGSLRGRLAAALMRPGIARIRNVFDYERAGGSPLLGVRGNVIITHGRARRRMVAFGVGVAATMARTGVPELIAAAFAEEAATKPEPPETTDAEAAARLESVS